MQPEVSGALSTYCPFTCSTTTEEAPHVQLSAERFAGADPAATVRTTKRQAKMRIRGRFI
jgi:hypothetical protein